MLVRPIAPFVAALLLITGVTLAAVQTSRSAVPKPASGKHAAAQPAGRKAPVQPAGKPTVSEAAGKQAAAQAEAIEKGRYLVQIMSCGDCHTPGTFYRAPDESRTLAGSEMGWAGPWGVHYAANLTPDLETGIGYWTAAELVKTLRSGKRPDGTEIGAPMPMQNITQLTEEDAGAIAAYLMSLKPIVHPVPAALKPGESAKGPVLRFPSPSAWDAPPPPSPSPADSSTKK